MTLSLSYLSYVCAVISCIFSIAWFTFICCLILSSSSSSKYRGLIFYTTFPSYSSTILLLWATGVSESLRITTNYSELFGLFSSGSIWLDSSKFDIYYKSGICKRLYIFAFISVILISLNVNFDPYLVWTLFCFIFFLLINLINYPI